MQWTGDVARGSWIAPRLHGWGTVNSTVPAGFDAYARIFHPFRASRGEQGNDWTWTELAEHTGRVLHPLAQAANLLGSQEYSTVSDWSVGFPHFGFLPPVSLAALVEPLRAATSTPNDVTIGVWDGWGELSPETMSVFAWFAEPHGSPEAAAKTKALEGELREHKSADVSAEVARAVHTGSFGDPRPLVLQLPGRDYVLLTTALDELADPIWPYRAGIGWIPDSLPFGGSGPMPQLIWPADRAWCIASEIDFDSTVVGGSRSLINEIVTSGLEALAVPEDGDLSENGDLINPKPPH